MVSVVVSFLDHFGNGWGKQESNQNSDEGGQRQEKWKEESAKRRGGKAPILETVGATKQRISNTIQNKREENVKRNARRQASC